VAHEARWRRGPGTKQKSGAESEDEDEAEEEEEAAVFDHDADDASLLSALRRCSLHAADSKTEKSLTKAELARKALDKKHDDHFVAFPVVITTYDLIMKDQALIGGIPGLCVLFLLIPFPLAFLFGFAPRLCDGSPSSLMPCS
jgi:hypothetical protein